MVELFISQGVDITVKTKPNRRDGESKTPLQIATDNNSEEIMILLKPKGKSKH